MKKILFKLMIINISMFSQIDQRINIENFKTDKGFYWQPPKNAQDSIKCQILEIERLNEYIRLLNYVREGDIDLMKIKILTCMSFRRKKHCLQCLEQLTK